MYLCHRVRNITKSKTNMTKEKKMYMRIRNLCGLLGILLPWLALFSAGIADHPSHEWWWSISATYYQSPALVGVLTPASIVLVTYAGYDKLDDWITTLSGVFGLGIVLFPCSVNWDLCGGNLHVGFFQLPMYVTGILHNFCAATFFMLLAFNSFFLFTKTNSNGEMTPRKRIRNRVYRICGAGMIIFEVIFAILTLCHAPGYCIMIIEIILLHLFGISWLVKGEAFPFLNDEVE